jgi:hypothetical protein
MQVNLQSESVTLGAGTSWGEVYDALAGTQYVVIGGLCPSVGVFGFLQVVEI